ncbi:MAG: class I SAM-dependent methyltransferase [Candidatus Bathyarchaeota archaeon]|nr:class I SAM-dependent methyltransferase [Candidatus Bathyarchaeota archaeon]
MPHKSIQLFCRLIAEEMHFRRANNLDYSYLKRKYENILFDENGKIMPIGMLGYTERLIPLVTELKKIKGQAKVLDVGCGCGSETLLMSLLGVEVIGIDLVPYRVDFARSRIPYYQSLSQNLLKIQFLNSNVFKYLETSECFNIIWLIEAISHIHPAEEFLQLGFNRLHDNGLLIISDSNALNPVSWYRSCRIRGSVRWYTHKRFKDIDCGKPIEVAEERIFSIFRFKKKLARAGFKIERIEMSGFMGSFFLSRDLLSNQRLANTLLAFQNIVKKIPILCLLGSNYTIIASLKI